MSPSDAFRDAVLAGRAPTVSLKELGLRGRGEVFIEADRLAVVIDRKSRWVRKDAARFLEVKAAAEAKVGRPLRGRVFVRTAPVCSQARAWMEEEDVTVETLL